MVGLNTKVEHLMSELAAADVPDFMLTGEELIMAAFLVKKSSLIDSMGITAQRSVVA
jgi:hypothetical protein